MVYHFLTKYSVMSSIFILIGSFIDEIVALLIEKQIHLFLFDNIKRIIIYRKDK